MSTASSTSFAHLFASEAEIQEKKTRRSSIPHEIEERFEEDPAPPRVVVPRHVMAVAGVTAGDDHAVGAVLERLDEEEGSIRPVQVSRTTRTFGRYCIRDVPARSAPAYVHQLQTNATIFTLAWVVGWLG